MNVPLREGADDDCFVPLFASIVSKAFLKHRSDAIVFVCGVDGLAQDPLGSFNLTQHCFEKCTFLLLQLARMNGVPLIVLGGGGYNVAHASACFASVVGVLQLNDGVSGSLRTMHVLPTDLPMESPFAEYDVTLLAKGTGFQRYCSKKTQDKNLNDRDYLTAIQSTVLANLDKIK